MASTSDFIKQWFDLCLSTLFNTCTPPSVDTSGTPRVQFCKRYFNRMHQVLVHQPSDWQTTCSITWLVVTPSLCRWHYSHPNTNQARRCLASISTWVLVSICMGKVLVWAKPVRHFISYIMANFCAPICAFCELIYYRNVFGHLYQCWWLNTSLVSQYMNEYCKRKTHIFKHA